MLVLLLLVCTAAAVYNCPTPHCTCEAGLRCSQMNETTAYQIKNEDYSKYFSSIRVSGSIIPVLRNGTFLNKYFSNVNKLKLSSNDIEFIESGALNGLNDLTELHLRFNKLRNLPSGIFQQNPHLSILHLEQNKFDSLSNESFLKYSPNLTWLNLNENNISVIEPKALYTLPNMFGINLSFNNISFLQSDVFQNNKKLFILFLNNNKFKKIKSVPIITNIERVFLGNNAIHILPNRSFETSNKVRLKLLSLSNNDIVEIEQEAFYGLHELVNLDLTGNNLTHLHVDIFKYIPKLEELKLGGNLLTKFVAMRYLSSMKYLYLRNNDISELTNETFFSANDSHLEYLYIDYNKISIITHGVFHHLSKLRELRISHNSIEFIHEETFQNNKNLWSVDLTANKLSQFDILFHAPWVSSWLLHENSISILKNNSIPEMSQLSNLDLSHNRITTIDQIPFTGLQKLNSSPIFNNNTIHPESHTFIFFPVLTMLDLSHNEISDLKLLKGIPLLKYFRITHNTIYALRNYSLTSCVHIQELVLSHNNITTVEKYAFYGLERMIDLYLSYNNIEYLPSDVFEQTKKLRRIEMTNNKLKSLAFLNIPSVQVCFLSHNKISFLIDNGIYNASALILIDLDNNEMSSISPKAFEGLKKLNYLDLSANLLISLPPKLFVGNTNLLDINLDNNSISELSFISNAPSVSGLQVSNNNITILHNDTFLTPETSNISRLNLANNRITTVEQGAFNGLKQLTHLNLSSNNITSLHQNTFADTTYLRNIDLSDNIPGIKLQYNSDNPLLTKDYISESINRYFHG